MTTSLAVIRLRLYIFRCNPSLFFRWPCNIWAKTCQKESRMHGNTAYFPPSMRGRACCWICYSRGFGSVTPALYMFFLLPLRLSSSSCLVFAFRQLYSLKLKLWSAFSHARRSALDVSDVVSNLSILFPFLVEARMRLFLRWRPAITPVRHSSQCVSPSPPLCLPSRTVKGSLSSWIRAGCQSRRRRQKDNARYLWWVVDKTFTFTRIDWGQFKAM